MKKLLYLFAGCALLGLSSCSDSPETAKSDYSRPIELSARARSVSDNATKMDLKIFQTINDRYDSTHNAIVAPLNLTTFLGMFSNMIDDEDFNAAICDYFDTDDKAAVNDLVSEYMKQLSQLDSRTKVSFTNKIWYDNSYTLSSSVTDVVEQYYDANFEAADFGNQENLKVQINRWVNNMTDGMIDNWNVDEIHRFLAAQVMLFNGTWTEEFDAAKTKEGVFHTPEGINDVVVPMMQGTLPGQYYATDDYLVLRFEFGSGEYVADFVLPREDVEIHNVIAEPDFGQWTEADMERKAYNVKMPKFSVNQEVKQLFGALKSIDPRFDIAGKHIALFEEDAENISSILQHVAFDISESGAKAVAVTYNGTVTAYRPDEAVFNRPFALMIRLRETGAVLIAARIANPLQK
ncbi:MAG: hypothetical protein K2M55_08785 [Muribaculaceae bacterium]|nr:hypothetical protein [Muribaculaceae bacterium]